jgi:hypothetical protein
LGGRIGDDVAKVVNDFIRAKEAALRARVDALHLEGEARRAAVNRIVSATETRIANQLAITLNAKLSQLSRETITGSTPMSDCAPITILTRPITRPYVARSEGSELVLT